MTKWLNIRKFSFIFVKYALFFDKKVENNRSFHKKKMFDYNRLGSLNSRIKF